MCYFSLDALSIPYDLPINTSKKRQNVRAHGNGRLDLFLPAHVGFL